MFARVFIYGLRDNNEQGPTLTGTPEENQISRLIGNKRKHLEKTLSAAQRNQLLLQEAKDDAQFRKTLAETLQESNQVFTELLHGMTDLGNSFCRSKQMLTQAMKMQSQPHQPVPQNMFFQCSQSLRTPTQQPPYFSSKTIRNSNMQISLVRTFLILNENVKKHISIFSESLATWDQMGRCLFI